MAGRIQFRDRKPEPVAWPARLLTWVRERWRGIIIRLRGKPEQPPAQTVPKRSGVRFKTPARDVPLVIRETAVHCPACGFELLSQSETVACTLNPAHVVHTRCGAELLKGKCPLDGAALEASG